VRTVGIGGLTVNLWTASHDSLIEVSVDHNDRWLVRFRNNHTTVGWSDIPIEYIPERGLRVDTLVVPSDAVDSGFTSVDLWPVEGDGKQSIGHLIPLD